jgi:hypothetical protein
MICMNENTIFPFTIEQLIKLREEIDDAGSFSGLMVRKKAIIQKKGTEYFAKYNDIEKYKEKYLTGVYETLRSFYDIEMPYVFWSDMHDKLLLVEAKKNK